MKILVVGRGWVGNKMTAELRSRGHEIDLVSHKKAFNVDPEAEYDWVVNCAGVTGSPNVDACENDKFATMKGNVVMPLLLQRLADEIDANFAHFSSGCIYQGEIVDPWAEPNFFGSTYSLSKGVSDSYLKHVGLIFRIRMPFTGLNEPKNYLSKVFNYAKNGKLVDSGKNSLTDLDEAVKVACNLIEEGAIGPYNLVNEGAVDMHELAALMGVEPQWYTPDEFKAATACGRSTCTIPGDKLMRPVKEALADAIAKMKNA
jgi:dTDP-4-dehydrorhamnose reductase